MNNQIKNNYLQIAFVTFLFGNVPFNFADFQLQSKEKNIIANRDNREEFMCVKAVLLHKIRPLGVCKYF